MSSETDFGHYYIGCICDSEPIRFFAITPDAEWKFITEDERTGPNSKFPTLFITPTIGLAKKQIEKIRKTTEYKNAKLFLVPTEDIEFWDNNMKGWN